MDCAMSPKKQFVHEKHERHEKRCRKYILRDLSCFSCLSWTILLVDSILEIALIDCIVMGAYLLGNDLQSDISIKYFRTFRGQCVTSVNQWVLIYRLF